MSKLRVIACVVNTRKLTMYCEDGNKVELLQGDPRLKPILDKAIPEIAATGVCEIELGERENIFREYEKTHNTGTRFFRVAKDMLNRILGRSPEKEETVTDAVVGRVPSTEKEDDKVAKVAKQMAAAKEIIKHAVPANSPNFLTDSVVTPAAVDDSNRNSTRDFEERQELASDTIVAVTPDGGIVPDMELMSSQLAWANKMGSPQGAEKFLELCAENIQDRGHEIKDLMKFIERGDMPIADDGHVIVFKALRKTDTPGIYVDIHSGNVTQKVGSKVFMSENLVDRNRRNECSNGLHVARRAYLGSFRGDVCVAAKVNPKDVIAVPLYDANKVRVCAYHIISDLTPEMYSLLLKNKPITDCPDGKVLLANLKAGHHVGVTQLVEITQQFGGGLSIKDMESEETTEVIAGKTTVTEVNPELDAIRGTTVESTKTVEPMSVDQISEVAKVQEVQQLSRKEKAAQLYSLYLDAEQGDATTEAARTLLAYKKVAKISWEKLGLSDEVGKELARKAGMEDLPALAEPAKAATAMVVAKPPRKLTQSEQAQDLYGKYVGSTPGANREAALQALVDFKKAAKKGWLALGIPDPTLKD